MARTHRLAAFLFAFASFAATAQAQSVFTFLARCDGAQETPPTITPSRGLGAFTIDTVANTIRYRVSFSPLTAPETVAHIHGFAPPGVAAGVLFGFTPGSPKCGTFTFTEAQQANLLAGLSYVNIHSGTYPGGEIRGQISEVPSHQNVCFGDGSGSPCPCGNFSVVGEDEGCLNSLGTGARLRGYGASSMSGDNLVMHHSRGPDSSALLFAGPSIAGGGGGVGAPFGDGLRCVAGGVTRLGAKTACSGTAYWPDIGELPISTADTGIVVGATRVYQTWYRNAAAFCTASTFNLSNATLVFWMP